MSAVGLVAALTIASAPVHADEPHASVTVHLSPQDVWLVGGPGRDASEHVCLAPCDVQVPAGAGYRIGFGAVQTPRRTSTFSLSSDAVIHASPPNEYREFFGTYLTLGGGGMALWSLAFLGLGALSDKGQTADSLYFFSGAFAAIAAGLAVPGILLLVFDGSSVTVNGAKVARGRTLPGGLAVTAGGVTF